MYCTRLYRNVLFKSREYPIFVYTRARTQTNGLTENLIKTFRVTRCVHDEYSRDAGRRHHCDLYLYLTATHCDVHAFKRKERKHNRHYIRIEK